MMRFALALVLCLTLGVVATVAILHAIAVHGP